MKKNDKLTQLLKEINETTKIANLELLECDPQTRPGMEMMRNQARNYLNELNFNYQKTFMNTLSKVFVSASKEKLFQFKEQMSKEIASFHVKSMYEEIAELVQPTLSSDKIFSSSAYLRLIEILGTYSRMHGVYPHTNPVEPHGFSVNSFQELIDVVRNVTRSSFGDLLHKSYIYNMLLSEALKTKFDGEYSILLLDGLAEEEKKYFLDGLFPGQPSFNLTIGDDDQLKDRSAVLKIFRKIAEYFNKTSELTTTELNERK